MCHSKFDFAGEVIPEFILTGPRSHGQDKPTADFGSPDQGQVVIRVKMRSLRGASSEGGPNMSKKIAHLYR